MSEKNQSKGDNQSEYTEITFNDIKKFLKRYYLILLGNITVCFVLGYGLSYLSPKMYSSQTILLPEQGPTNGGGFLASLAGLGGVSAIEKIGAVRTDLYPNVMKSLPFALFMLKQPVKDINNIDYKSLKDFVSEKPGKSIFGSNSAPKLEIAIPKLSNQDVLVLLPDEENEAKLILSSISTVIDQKTGVITIESEMKDPVVAALVTSSASKYLLNYVEDYRTGKTAREVLFLENRMSEAKQREQRAEYALQSYRDKNRNAYLNTARIEEQRLQTDFTLAQSLYSDLSRKYEQAKVKVKEEQPIFKVLEPARVSLKTSKPRRLLMAFSISFIGLLATFGIIFLRKNNTVLTK